MFAKRVTIFIAVAWSACAFAQKPGTKIFDPNDPLKSRVIVSREDRERIGLDEKTWPGVVHPNVSQAFERLKIQPEDRIERFKFNQQQRFKGSVYVQVHLKHTVVGQADSDKNKAAIAAVQKRVLGSLTAAEFHLMQGLEKSPGLIGHATKGAIAKLTVHPDVVGVCLDDKPAPQRALPILTKDKLPPLQPDEYANEPGVVSGKAEKEVYQALNIYGRVDLRVSLHPVGEPIPKLTHVRSEYGARLDAHNKAVRELEDRVLSTLTADDFWLNSRVGGATMFSGFASREGVEKLLKHPEVTDLFIDVAFTLDKREMRTRWGK